MDRNKLIMIFGGAALAASLLTWVLYRSTVAPKGEKMVKVYAANGNFAAGTRITKERIKLISLVEKSVPAGAILIENQALDRVSMFPITANETLIATRLSGVNTAEGFAAMIEKGKRAVSVPVSDSTGAGGLIQPRSHVDVIFTKSGSLAEAVSTTIVEDVVVLSVGRMMEVPASPAASDKPAAATTAASASPAAASNTQQRSAVLLVSPEEARKLELARNQGKISLALRNPQDDSRSVEIESVTAENLDPNIYDRLALSKRGGRGRLPGNANLKNDAEWCKIVGCESMPKAVSTAPPKPVKPEPPKPRAIVDVFHGDKHVQEAFHD